MICHRSKKLKIIGFDGWTGGIRHYQRLIPALKSKGFEFLLIHLGSWGSDTGRISDEVIGNVHVRDIRYYNKMNFSEIIDQEKPAAVIFYLAAHSPTGLLIGIVKKCLFQLCCSIMA